RAAAGCGVTAAFLFGITCFGFGFFLGGRAVFFAIPVVSPRCCGVDAIGVSRRGELAQNESDFFDSWLFALPYRGWAKTRQGESCFGSEIAATTFRQWWTQANQTDTRSVRRKGLWRNEAWNCKRVTIARTTPTTSGRFRLAG